MNKKQKLELNWIGKDSRPKLEPRILLEDFTRSYHAKCRVALNDQYDNRLIFGDTAYRNRGQHDAQGAGAGIWGLIPGPR